MVGFEDVCGVRAARELCVRPVCAYCVSLYGIYEDVSWRTLMCISLWCQQIFLKNNINNIIINTFQFYYIGLVLGW